MLAVIAAAAAEVRDAPHVAAKIDALLQEHWQKNKTQPAKLCNDATFLRRVTLDLAGRIPTLKELDAFLADQSKNKRQRFVQALIDGPEFSMHFGNVLDQMIQGDRAGDAAFLEYVRQSLRDRKSWSAMFREMMIGPWTDKTKAANLFIDKRARNTEALTAAATRVFFGVDVSCAKCHDHPLVRDWKQDHFYGMMSFFNRTTGGKGKVGEKTSGEVTFVKNGKETTAKMMFLTGRIIEEPAKDKKKKYSRREQLVEVALEEKRFFSRAIVNRLWEYFFGRGLVTPVDQMHLSNEPAAPELLAWLADDFANSDYDLQRLITGIVSSNAYQLSSRWKGEAPPDKLFAVARLRPLSRTQFAFSLILATDNGKLGDEGKRAEQYLAIEERAKSLLSSLDPRRAEHQSSTGEALFLSNHAETQKLIIANGNNLAARLGKLDETKAIVTTAFRNVLSRSPQSDELDDLIRWFDAQKQPQQKTCEQLVWALVTSAEFRFNH